MYLTVLSLMHKLQWNETMKWNTMKYKFKASLMMYVNSTKLLLTMYLVVKWFPNFTCHREFRQGLFWHELSSLVDVDYVTPLCSQLTYEGLLDETFGIKCGRSPQNSRRSNLANNEDKWCFYLIEWLWHDKRMDCNILSQFTFIPC